VHRELPMVASYAQAAPGIQKPVGIDAAPSAMTLWNSFRRRWPLAIGLGMLTAICAALAVWFLAPRASDISAYLYVHRDPPVILSQGNRSRDVNEFAVFKQTQVNILKGPYVLNAAMRRPGISQLAMIRKETDPVGYLAGALRAVYPGEAEVMQVSLNGDNPKETAELINAIVDAFIEEWVNKQRGDTFRRKELLDKKYQSITKDINVKTAQRDQIIRESNVMTAEQGELQKALLMQSLADARSTLRETNTLLGRADSDISQLEIQIQNFQPNSVPEDVIESALMRDPEYLLKQRLLTEAMTKLSAYTQILPEGSDSDPKVMRAQAEVDGIRDEIATLKAQMRPQILATFTQQDSTLGILQGQLEAIKKSREGYAERSTSLQESIKDMTRDIGKLGSSSTDIGRLDYEIEMFRGTLSKLGEELRHLDIELEAPARIEVIDRATPLTAQSVLTRYIMVGFTGVLAMALTAFAVTLFEFQARRISSTTEVSEGLGLRLIGAIPSLTGRARKGKAAGADAIVNIVSESVNGIRTLLLHHANDESSPRVIMVTSAGEGEAKTTLASQLALSLARAGRRTLLVDGALRNPGQQRVFGMSLEPGFSELLRGECDLMDVIRPTRAEGLWFISAGYVDRDGIEALARDGVQEIFDKIRPDFDFIIIDSGSVLGIADTLLLGQYVDTTILSVLRDVSQTPRVFEAYERLTSVGIPVLGAVISGVQTATGKHRLPAPKPAPAAPEPAAA
jgi:capsular exopolysaccharide synthesis family protein